MCDTRPSFHLHSVLFVLMHVMLVQTQHAQCIVNEIHPTPSAGEPEWIELVNLTNRSVNISSWYVCDNRTCSRLADDLPRIPPDGYAVLTRDSAALREARPLPSNAIVIEVKLPSLNNTVDEVMLRNSDSTRVDSLSYTLAWGRKGLSLERAADDDTVWLASLSTDSATCGYLNSVVRLQHDVRIAELRAGHGSLDVVFVNHGRSTSQTRLCTMWLDGVLYDVLRTTVPALLENEVHIWSVDVATLLMLHPNIDVDGLVVLTDGDDRGENDTLRRSLTLPPLVNAVTITEIMSDPFESQADYVEIYNGSSDTIDLDGWYVADGSITDAGERPCAVVEGGLRLAPGEYGAVLMDTMRTAMIDAEDKTRMHICQRGINANASGDALALYTPSGFLVDTVLYSTDMHVPSLAATKGVAIEKRHPNLSGLSRTSWTSSGDLRGGTPARANSVQIDVPTTTSIEALPNPFSSKHGDARYPCAIAFSQPFLHALVGLRILTTDGVHVRWLLNAAFAGSQSIVIWDGADDMGRRVPPGPYVASLEAADAMSVLMHRDVAVIVVGE